MKTTESPEPTPETPPLLPQDRLFLPQEAVCAIAERYGTPCVIFDEKGLRKNAKSLQTLFHVVPQTEHYFPVRRCPDREILRILREEGLGVRCETPAELRLAAECGFPGDRVRYAAMSVTQELAQTLREMDAELQIYSPLPLPGLLPRRVTLACAALELHNLRLLPVLLRKTRVGLTTEELFLLLPALRDAGVSSFGLLMHSDSNNTDVRVPAAKLEALHHEANLLTKSLGIHFERFDLGGGIGLQLRKDAPQVEPEKAAELLRTEVEELGDVTQTLSFGFERRLVDPFAILLTTVQGVYRRKKPVIVVDADAGNIRFNTVNRYRHVSIVGREMIAGRILCDVVGPRGLNSDWVAENRLLQIPRSGELLTFRDVGGSLPAGPQTRLLYCADGTVKCLQHGEE